VASRSLSAPAGFDFDATVRSHGWYDLPPFHLGESRLERVLVSDGEAHDVVIRMRGARIAVDAGPDVRADVARMLQLAEDLTPFYALTDEDPALAYARARGAGRLLRGPTVFEDVVKMLCTTNCSWSLTRVMVGRLVDELGRRAPSGRRAFPTPAEMAQADERFFRDVVRAGYRAPHLVWIAKRAASGALDLEQLPVGDAETVRDRLLGLPGIGPYAADNLLRLFGRYGYLGLDSWCRGRLKELYPRTRDVDAFARRRYRRYGEWQGLAMWLDVTRDWHEG
jgi:N-glycosylase/DNA lyase